MAINFIDIDPSHCADAGLLTESICITHGSPKRKRHGATVPLYKVAPIGASSRAGPSLSRVHSCPAKFGCTNMPWHYRKNTFIYHRLLAQVVWLFSQASLGTKV
eukprot:s1190_g4.t1